jgi:hypothetical protein
LEYSKWWDLSLGVLDAAGAEATSQGWVVVALKVAAMVLGP